MSRYATGASRPARGTRTPFTAEDDRTLAAWVAECQRQNRKILGNEIYQNLAERVGARIRRTPNPVLTIPCQNPRHSYQSWRDRWIKYVSKTSHTVRHTQPAPITPPSDAPRERSGVGTRNAPRRKSPTGIKAAESDFSKDDFQVLLAHGDDIADMVTDCEDVAWDKWAKLDRVRHIS